MSVSEVRPAVEIKPAQQSVTIRDQQFTLTAMSDNAAIDWALLQVLSARQKVTAAEQLRAGREDDLRESVRLLLQADYELVSRALGCELAFVAELSDGERALVVNLQDELNRVGTLLPFLNPSNQAAAAFLEVPHG